jgi:hypothetical protein
MVFSKPGKVKGLVRKLQKHIKPGYAVERC